MKTITHSDLLQLVDQTGDPCISLYVPIYTGAENRQNSTRLKKLFRNAEDALIHRGAQKTFAQEMLAPANDRLSKLTFSEEIGQSLAVFLRRGEFHVYGIHVPCDELCIVGSHFYI